MASPASGTGEFPLRCCGSPVQGRDASGIQAYPRSIRGEGFARFMKRRQGKAGRKRGGYGAQVAKPCRSGRDNLFSPAFPHADADVFLL